MAAQLKNGSVLSQPALARKIKSVLMEGFEKGGVKAEVRTEAVPTTKLQRVLVLSNNFKRLKPSERQNLVWRIASQGLEPDEQLRISMMLTLTPEEYGEK